MTYLSRDITNTILAALKEMPVVVLAGMRQTGKSTFLQNQPELAKRRYVTLDDFSQLAAAKADPDNFISGGDPLSIDEAQKCPELFLAIKRAVDRNRRPGRFLLSGSANFLLLKNLGDSLAGRAAYFNLGPFSRRELEGSIKNPPFIKRFFENQEIASSISAVLVTMDDVVFGGMPLVCLAHRSDPSLWFKGYEQTYLDRDIRDLGRIGNIIAFRNLLRLAAFRSGKILSQGELGRDAKLSSATVTNYLSFLEVSCVAYRLAPYMKNPSARIIKSPKLYFRDSGLACYLAGIDDLTDHSMLGMMMETYVAQNLSGILDAAWPQAQLYFWNIQGRHEVDFVIEAQRKCMAIEIKSAARWDKNDLSGLNAFLAASPACIGGILACNIPTAVKIGDRLWAVPIAQLLE
jgi:uncharacterized protein